MVGSSKILTVSYGTFSCTLEGFDDSFDTMKAIAEYFRDLAADDRYFGAEPPSPDAEMLARIAEREIARRVEAHEERGQIVLRAGSGQSLIRATEVEPAEPATKPKHAPKAEQEREPSVAAAPAAEVTPEPFDTNDAEEETAVLTESVEAEAETDATVAEDLMPEQPEGLEDETGSTHPEPVLTEPAYDSESIASKLSRIRSVVSQSDGAVEDQYTEDEHAQDFLDNVTEDLTTALAADDDAEANFIEDELDEDAPVATGMAAVESTEIYASEEFVDAYDEADDFEDTLAALMADAEPKLSGPEATAPVTQETEVDAPPMASVIKVKRAEFEAAVANGLFEEEEDDDFNDEEEDNLFEGHSAALSPDEEAELQRELAEVEAELAFEDAGEPEADIRDEPEEEVSLADPAPLEDPQQIEMAGEKAEEPGASRFGRAAGSSDLTRIFEKTDTQLDAPASSQRRNAIQHLRAAVAATRAEHSAGSSLRENVDDSAYRSDLANVVRPRRPQIAAPTERSVRPEEGRPAPLKLVAEQRIDMPRAPIRPRRISSSDLEADVFAENKDASFSDFAEEMGASSLPDLLEAAAAYLSDVEGRPQFSRPMLMGKLKEVEQERFSREDGLRSFGQLLRQGKLQKLAGGRFAVTEETEFRASGRRQAG